MKYPLFALLVLIALVNSLFGPAHLQAGFDLIVDENTLRQVNGYWEIDVKIKTVGTPTTIYSLLLNLKMFPADGEPEDTLNGISFVGLSNDAPDRLFPSAEINLAVPVPDIMPGSLVSPIEVSAPDTEKTAFTVRFVSYRADPTNVRIGFMDVGNFYQIDRSEGPRIYDFNNLLRSANVSVTGVPEPGVCLLAAGAMAAAVLRRRKRTAGS